VGDEWERNHLKDIGLDRRVILKYIFKKRDGVARIGSIWFRIGTDERLL
jgi:hypothetical protein